VITKFSWRRALAVPAALSLALGGVLLTSTAASAAVGDLVVTSPAEGSTTTSRDVDIVGSAVAGSSIRVFSDTTRTTLLGSATTDRTTGAFTVDLPAYAETASSRQSVFVDGIAGGSGFSDAKTVAFRLPISKFLTVATPTEGQVLDTRTVTFSGTASEGSTVVVSNAAGELGRQNLGNATSYAITYTYADTSAAAQSVTVNGTLGGSGITPVTRAFSIPAPVVAPAPAKVVALDTPVAGTTTASRTVTFSGTAPVGSTVVVNGPTGELGRQNLGSGSTYSIVVTYSDTAPVAQTVTVSGFVGGSGFDNTVTRSFILPAVAAVPVTPTVLTPPVITSPIPDQVIVGSDVVISGTGTPGDNIAYVVFPKGQTPQSSAPFEEAITDESIVVDAAGNWTTTLRNVEAGSFTVVAFAFTVDADGVLTGISGDSNSVDFSVVAATAVAAAVTPVRAPGGLAYTGSDNQGLALGLGAALTLAGAGLAFAARRRAKLATVTGSDSE
jgi:hypothetical protein